MEQIKQELQSIKLRIKEMEEKISKMESESLQKENISRNTQKNEQNIKESKEASTSQPSPNIVKEISEISKLNIIQLCNNLSSFGIKDKAGYNYKICLFNLVACWLIEIDNKPWMKTLNYGKYNKVNFYLGAPPSWIRHMFDIRNILYLYPSQNLREIYMLPVRIKVAIKEFVRVTKLTNIYIRFFTAVPKWDDYLIPVKNVIKIGLTRKLFDPNSQNIHDVTP
ncbi:Uncharacterized protein Adt_41080 [Abeliophyllum distichum]|uniref:Uncharacterized protein n=1 Tax=Abeliophyllum distichum TaxID=126358 RepID=A0ABD1PMU0_9LAMI